MKFFHLGECIDGRIAAPILHCVLRQPTFCMEAEKNIEEAAKNYEETILRKIPRKVFDLVMLGMGDDGHVASLFPKTEGLNLKKQPKSSQYLQYFLTF